MTYQFMLWLLTIIFVVSACTTQEPPSPTPDIDTIVASTVSAREQAFYTPELRSPVDGFRFANPASVVLEWDWVRDLDQGEFYDVRVWRAGEPDFGISWASQEQFPLADWLSQQESGEFLWSIAVIEGDLESGTVSNTIGQAPPPRRFIVDSMILPTSTPEPTAEPRAIDDIVRNQPENFTIELVAQIDEAQTAITDVEFASDGSLFALVIDGRLYHLQDTNQDGTFETTEQVLSPELGFEWAIGIALYQDRIYVSDQSRIGYLQDTDNDGIYETYTNLIDDLPGRVYPLHSNNGILIYDDLLYIAVGSTTDHGPIREEFEAAILTMELDGSDLQVFATGFRNPYDLTMSPDGRLFTGDNSPDAYDNDLTFLPPEEVNYVREGLNYGFPDVYGEGLAIREIDYETQDPITELITSTATVGLVYYGATQFPEQYQDGLFVAQFGGINPGGNILYIPLEETVNGNYRGDWQPFIRLNNGFTPVSLELGADGSLYIVEWSFGYILRVSYSG